MANIKRETKRVAVYCQGVAAHLRPHVPVVRELQAQGHEVMIFGPEKLRELAERVYDVPFTAAGPDWFAQGTVGADTARLLLDLGNDAFNQKAFEELAGSTAAMVPGLKAATQEFGADLIISEDSALAATVVGDVLSIPVVYSENGLMRQVHDLWDSTMLEPYNEARVAAGLEPEPAGEIPAPLRRIIVPTVPELLHQGIETGTYAPFQHVNPVVTRGRVIPDGVFTDPDAIPFYAMFGSTGANIPEWRGIFENSIRSTIAAAAEIDKQRQLELVRDGRTEQQAVQGMIAVGKENVRLYADIGDATMDEVGLRAWPARHAPNVMIVANANQPAVLGYVKGRNGFCMNHAGFGSLREIFEEAVPTIWAPNQTDQPGNAQQMGRNNLGVVVENPRQATVEQFTEAMYEVIARRAELGANMDAINEHIAQQPTLEQVVDRMGQAFELAQGMDDIPFKEAFEQQFDRLTAEWNGPAEGTLDGPQGPGDNLDGPDDPAGGAVGVPNPDGPDTTPDGGPGDAAAVPEPTDDGDGASASESGDGGASVAPHPESSDSDDVSASQQTDSGDTGASQSADDGDASASQPEATAAGETSAAADAAESADTAESAAPHPESSDSDDASASQQTDSGDTGASQSADDGDASASQPEATAAGETSAAADTAESAAPHPESSDSDDASASQQADSGDTADASASESTNGASESGDGASASAQSDGGDASASPQAESGETGASAESANATSKDATKDVTVDDGLGDAATGASASAQSDGGDASASPQAESDDTGASESADDRDASALQPEAGEAGETSAAADTAESADTAGSAAPQPESSDSDDASASQQAESSDTAKASASESTNSAPESSDTAKESADSASESSDTASSAESTDATDKDATKDVTDDNDPGDAAIAEPGDAAIAEPGDAAIAEPGDAAIAEPGEATESDPAKEPTETVKPVEVGPADMTDLVVDYPDNSLDRQVVANDPALGPDRSNPMEIEPEDFEGSWEMYQKALLRVLEGQDRFHRDREIRPTWLHPDTVIHDSGDVSTDPAEQPGGDGPTESAVDDAPAEQAGDGPAESSVDDGPAEDDAPAEQPGDDGPAESSVDDAPAEQPGDHSTADGPADDGPADGEDEGPAAAPASEPDPTTGPDSSGPGEAAVPEPSQDGPASSVEDEEPGEIAQPGDGDEPGDDAVDEVSLIDALVAPMHKPTEQPAGEATEHPAGEATDAPADMPVEIPARRVSDDAPTQELEVIVGLFGGTVEQAPGGMKMLPEDEELDDFTSIPPSPPSPQDDFPKPHERW